MKKLFILFSTFLISFMSLAEEFTVFDKQLETLQRLFTARASNVFNGVYALITLLAVIQITYVFITQYSNDIKQAVIQIIRISMTFVLNLAVIRYILNGNIMKFILEIAYYITSTMTGKQYQNISSVLKVGSDIRWQVYSLKQELNFSGWDVLDGSIFTKFLSFIIIIFISLLIAICFFYIAIELFGSILKITVAIMFSSILIPLTMTDWGKKLYSIQTFLKLCVNSVLTICTINVLAVVVIKTLQEAGLKNLIGTGVNYNSLLSVAILSLICVAIVRKVKINI